MSSCRRLRIPNVAFAEAVDSLGDAFSDLQPDGTKKPIKFTAEYPDSDDHFVVDTSLGEVRVEAIEFVGDVSTVVSKIDQQSSSEYFHSAGEAIAQSILFEPQKVNGVKFAINCIVCRGPA